MSDQENGSTNHTEENSNGLQKRKRSDSEENSRGFNSNAKDLEDAKKQKTSEIFNGKVGPHHIASPATMASATPVPFVRVVSETADSMNLEIPHDKVGQLIGSKGMVIVEVQQRSGAKAIVNQDFPPGVPRQVMLSGTKTQMASAMDLIRRIVEIGPTAIHANAMTGGPMITTVIEASQPQIGKIIGTGGQNIKEIQQKSGAKVQIDQDYPIDVPRKINITGTSTAVNIAVQLVQNIMNTGHLNPSSSAAPTPSFPSTSYTQPPAATPMPASTGAGGEMRQSMDISKSIVGKIIGKGGETIQLLKKKSGCQIHVDQQVPEGYPCKVNFVGTAHTVAIAQHLIQEIMMGVPTHKVGANLPPQIPTTAMSAFPAAPAAAAAAAPAAYVMPPYAMAMPQQPYPYAYPPQMPYPPYGMPQVYPPYAQPAPAATPMPTAAPGGYGAMPGAAGSYGSHHPAGGASSTTKQGPSSGSSQNKSSSSSSVWTEHKTDDNIPYWYNASTGVSQWERPKNM